MENKKFLFIFSCLVFLLIAEPSSVWSQGETVQGIDSYKPDIISPSPTISSLQRLQDVSVNEFTGVHQYSIPLYTISTSELNIPISHI